MTAFVPQLDVPLDKLPQKTPAYPKSLGPSERVGEDGNLVARGTHGEKNRSISVRVKSIFTGLEPW